MNLLVQMAFAAALSQLVALSPARAQETSQSVVVVTYIEVLANAKSQAAALLKPLAETSRKEAGALRFEALERIGQGNQFVLLETWKDQAALDAHAAAASTKKFREQMTPLVTAPIDDRFCVPLAVASIAARLPAQARYAITHVDIGPPNPASRDKAEPVLKAFSAASRQDAGNLVYDLVVQKGRLNHFKTIEAWNGQAAADAHAVAARTKEFRATIAPWIGALYDQRWFSAL